MPSGGARNRSGPRPDPKSGRSDRRGYVLTALPNEGYTSKAPAFPLPTMRVYRWETEDKRRFQVFDADLTEVFRERELEVWAEQWRSPQGCAWSMESWRWATIAEFCRLKVVVEQEPGSNASLVSQLHRYRDQLGLTPAGMKDNGWAIASDQVSARAAKKATAAPETARPRRLRAAGDGGQ